MTSTSRTSGPRGTPAQHTVRVTGMTCAACERRVARALGRLPGVRQVTASAARGRVMITGTLPPGDQVRAAVESAGYQLGAPSWLARDRRVWATAVSGGLTAGVAVLLLLRTPAADWTPAVSLGGPVLALLVGLAAGVSTCMALVGGLVLGVSAAASAGDRPAWRAQLSFTAGRWAAFAAGGAMLGTLGSAAILPDALLAIGMLAAATVMIILGIRLTGISPRVSGWALTLPRRWGDQFGGSGGRRGAAAAGAATFLLPCGFTQAMQLYAVSQGSATTAAVTMTAFAVGTTPGLLGLGLLGGAAQRRAVRAPAATGTRLVGVVVLSFALVTASGGLRALGVVVPGLDRLPGSSALVPTTVSANVTMDGTRQVVTLTQTSGGYVPADTVVWANLPIQWKINATAGYNCSSLLRVPALGIKADLSPSGLHVVDLPALKPGTTRFRCAMGMFTGTLRAIPRTA